METTVEGNPSVTTPESTQSKIFLVAREAPPAYTGTEDKTDMLNKITPEEPEFTMPYKLRLGLQRVDEGVGSLPFKVRMEGNREGKIVIPGDTRSEDAKDAMILTETPDGKLKITKGGEDLGAFTKEELEKQTAVLDLGNDTFLGLTRFDPENRLVEVYKMKNEEQQTIPEHNETNTASLTPEVPPSFPPAPPISEVPHSSSNGKPAEADFPSKQNGIYTEGLNAYISGTVPPEANGKTGIPEGQQLWETISGRTDTDPLIVAEPYREEIKTDTVKSPEAVIPPVVATPEETKTEVPSMEEMYKDYKMKPLDGTDETPKSTDSMDKFIEHEGVTPLDIIDTKVKELKGDTELDRKRERSSSDLAERVNGRSKSRIAGRIAIAALVGLVALSHDTNNPRVNVEDYIAECFTSEETASMPSQEAQPVALAETPYVQPTEPAPTFQLSDNTNAVAEKGFMEEQQVLVKMFETKKFKWGDTLNKLATDALKSEFPDGKVPDVLRRTLMLATAKANAVTNPDKIVAGKKYDAFSQEYIRGLVEYYKAHPDDPMFESTSEKIKKGDYNTAKKFFNEEQKSYDLMMRANSVTTEGNNVNVTR